jgi:predicted nucleotidyltransferase
MIEHRFKPDNKKKQKIKSILNEAIGSINEVEFAYIYGSFLKDSGFHDIDVAVYLRRIEHRNSLECELSISSMLEKKIRFPVDVRILNYAPNSFCYEVTRGEVIFSRNEGLRSSFIERTWNIYLDYKPVAKNILHDLVAW